MSVGTRHLAAVDLLNQLLFQLDRANYHLRTESPLTLPEDGEPLPDAVILHGGSTRWIGADRYPLPADVVCVFEAASSSLVIDRGAKLEDYALDRIPLYVIVNLVEDQVEVYTQPSGDRFAESHVLRAGDTLTIPLDNDDTLSVPVADLLPQPSSR
ncbi:MAG: Uma2 family endonuclease [Planctomycetota bacterium]